MNTATRTNHCRSYSRAKLPTSYFFAFQGRKNKPADLPVAVREVSAAIPHSAWSRRGHHDCRLRVRTAYGWWESRDLVAYNHKAALTTTSK